MLTTIATLIVGIYLIVSSQETVSSTFTLIVGLVVGILALAELVGVRLPARTQ